MRLITEKVGKHFSGILFQCQKSITWTRKLLSCKQYIKISRSLKYFLVHLHSNLIQETSKLFQSSCSFSFNFSSLIITTNIDNQSINQLLSFLKYLEKLLQAYFMPPKVQKKSLKIAFNQFRSFLSRKSFVSSLQMHWQSNGKFYFRYQWSERSRTLKQISVFCYLFVFVIPLTCR